MHYLAFSLTVAMFFLSQVLHNPSSSEWTLVVRYAQVRDSGLYDCHVHTDPKLAKTFTLAVEGEGCSLQFYTLL